MSVIEINKLTKKYKEKIVIQDFNLMMQVGEFIAIKGVSGCGKSTLLNIIGGLVEKDSGEVLINGKNISMLNTKSGRKVLSDVQYLFQKPLLIESKSVRYNLNISRKRIFKNHDDSKLKEVLKKVNLNLELNQKCFELSGGEQQRLVLARLLLTSPKIILCDEPAGSLDSDNADLIYSILNELSQSGITVLCVSHDEYISKYVDRTITIS